MTINDCTRFAQSSSVCVLWFAEYKAHDLAGFFRLSAGRLRL